MKSVGSIERTRGVTVSAMDDGRETVLVFGLDPQRPEPDYLGGLYQARLAARPCAGVEDAYETLRAQRPAAALVVVGTRTRWPAPLDLDALVERCPSLRLVAVVDRTDATQDQALGYVAELLRRGLLFDVLTMPVVPADLSAVVRRAMRLSELENRVLPPSAEAEGGGAADRFMVGSSPAMRKVFDCIRRFGAVDAPVLITGESGTGKELAARAIHERSSVRGGPFVAINCAGLPPTLIESELFGHERGAFTGAVQRKIGRIEAASRGTCFLDEIGDLPIDVQGRLLRFVQEKTIERVGGTQTFPVDARIVAATHVDLLKASGEGRFREDLYYRLDVLTIRMPALRERGDDIGLLANFFLERFARELHRPVTGFRTNALDAIRHYQWPGNVREMISVIRRAVVMTDGRWLGADDLALPIEKNGRRRTLPTIEQARETAEAALIQDALAVHGGNVQRVARDLMVSRATLYRLLAKYGLGGTA